MSLFSLIIDEDKKLGTAVSYVSNQKLLVGMQFQYPTLCTKPYDVYVELIERIRSCTNGLQFYVD